MGQPEVTSELVDYPANGRHPIPSKQLGSGIYWVAKYDRSRSTETPAKLNLRCFGYDSQNFMPEEQG